MLSPAAFAELAVHFHGAVGLYRESHWFSLVRVVAISFDEREVRARVEMIPTPGLRSDQDSAWEVSSIWSYLDASPTHWRQAYPCVSIEFDRELVEAVVAFAATLPPGFAPEHATRIWQFIEDFWDADEPEEQDE